RDRLCHLLDEKCEQLVQAQEHLKHDDEAVLTAQRAANQLQERFDQLSVQHSRTLENLREQNDIIEQLQQNEQSLEAQIQLKNSEIHTLSEDLRNMTSEVTLCLLNVSFNFWSFIESIREWRVSVGITREGSQISRSIRCGQ
ncbi:hypothetical protein BVRB_022040, partial [Beta vulgaris subsp. vulgaris]